MKKRYLYEMVNRVPEISDAQVAEMRHILPLLRSPNSVMYRNIAGSSEIDPRNASLLWDAKPEGPEFTFDQLNQTTIITQHHSSVFFKPSLAEVYAWIRVYLGDEWRAVTHFCMGEARRLPGVADVACDCVIMGGDQLVQGDPVILPSGSVAYALTPRESEETKR